MIMKNHRRRQPQPLASFKGEAGNGEPTASPCVDEDAGKREPSPYEEGSHTSSASPCVDADALGCL